MSIKGNQYWKLRKKHGRDMAFKNEEELWDKCCDYFEWVEANPLWESKLTTSKGEPIEYPVQKMRAMTIGGLCLHIGIDQSTWEDYRTKKDFSRITNMVDAIIREQKFTGAAAGLFNPNIIARDLGLTDKQEVDQRTHISINGLSDEELERIVSGG